MFIVGITGGIGSGKSAVSDFLMEQGVKIVDADIVAREVVMPESQALQAIQEHFGDSVIDPIDKTLNRAALRKIVFDDGSSRKWLEELLHPAIRTEIIHQLKSAASSYAVLTSPLLLETDQHLLTQHIVVVDTSEKHQIQRTMSRDSNDEEQVRAIIAAQMPRDQKLERADTVISNQGSLEDLHKQCILLHEELLSLAEERSN